MRVNLREGDGAQLGRQRKRVGRPGAARAGVVRGRHARAHLSQTEAGSTNFFSRVGPWRMEFSVSAPPRTHLLFSEGPPAQKTKHSARRAEFFWRGAEMSVFSPITNRFKPLHQVELRLGAAGAIFFSCDGQTRDLLPFPGP